MSREIKFRAWDDGKMFHSHNNDINRGSHQLSWFFNKVREDAIIMQFTGLHDRTGKEIYEGDFDQYGCVVKYYRGSFTVERENNDAWSHLLYIDDFEVIGNIYENSDIL